MKNHIRFLSALSLAFCLSVAPLLALQAQSKAQAKVNVNTASLAELQKLPRVGPKVAQRIIDFRKEHGPFKKAEDLMKVRGIGEKVFKGLKDLVTVGQETGSE